MSGQVIAFPAAHLRAHIVDAARMLGETHGEAANTAWKTLMRTMAERLIATGLSDGEMRRQILEFQGAVQLELMAQSEREHQAHR
jgi:hypothetical protein